MSNTYTVKSGFLMFPSLNNVIHRLVFDKDGHRWAYPVNIPEAGEEIYVETDGCGFGGRSLQITLENGKIDKLNDPWHSNSNALFAATGVDLRNKFRTFVVIGLDRSVDKHGNRIITDVLYQDNNPKIGSFKRGEELAKIIAKELNKTVFLYKESRGGRMFSPIEP